MRLLLATLLALGVTACTKQPSAESAPSASPPAATEPAASEPAAPAPAPAPAADPQADLIAKGKAVYLAYCGACHNSNPKLAGTLGPDVHGSSMELLEARVVKGDYPPGYEPKRKSKAMVPLPQVKNDLPAIHAFLNAP